MTNKTKLPLRLQLVDGEAAAGPAASPVQAAVPGVQAAAAPDQAERAAQLPDARPGHQEPQQPAAPAAEPQPQRLRGALHKVRKFSFCN